MITKPLGVALAKLIFLYASMNGGVATSSLAGHNRTNENVETVRLHFSDMECRVLNDFQWLDGCARMPPTAGSRYKAWIKPPMPDKQYSSLAWLHPNESIVVPQCSEVDCSVPTHEPEAVGRRQDQPSQSYFKTRSTLDDALYDPSMI